MTSLSEAVHCEAIGVGNVNKVDGLYRCWVDASGKPACVLVLKEKYAIETPRRVKNQIAYRLRLRSGKEIRSARVAGGEEGPRIVRGISGV